MARQVVKKVVKTSARSKKFTGVRIKKSRTRMDWIKRRDGLTEHEFRKRYRLSKELFADVVRQLTPYVASVRQMVGSNSPIPIELQLSMTLRYLAGGAVVDIIDLHGVAYSTFYTCLWRTLEALDKAFKLSFDVTDNTEMANLEEGFAQLTGHVLRGIVGALDGLAIKIQKPWVQEVPDPMAFFNRKGFFAVNVQAICDSNRRFKWYAASTCGSTHDATAFSATRLMQRLHNGCMDNQWSIAADEAYAASRHVITPYSGRGLPIEKDSFNFYQSRCRINIECSFGMLVRRWGVF
jgi:hypothetical protein